MMSEILAFHSLPFPCERFYALSAHRHSVLDSNSFDDVTFSFYTVLYLVWPFGDQRTLS